MLRALAEYEIEGLTTLMPFHRALLATEQWARGETCRDLLEDRDWLQGVAAERSARGDGEDDDERGRARLHRRGLRPALRRQGHRPARAGRRPTAPRRRRPARAARPRPRRAERSGGGGGAGGDTLVSPLQGNVFKVLVETGADGRGGRPRLRHRGDEDGERDHRPQVGHDRRAADQRGRRRWPAATRWPSSRRRLPVSHAGVAGQRGRNRRMR